jgi:HEAT repeat protein
MATPSRRRWFGRIAIASLVVLVGGGAWNWTSLHAMLVAYELRTAASDVHRVDRARALVLFGEPGRRHLLAALRDGDEATCTALATAIRELHTGQPVDAELARALVTEMPGFGAPGRDAVVYVLPVIMEHADESLHGPSRTAVELGLKGSPKSKVIAARLAVRLRCPEAVMPLLTDHEPEVRAAVLAALGTAGEASPLGDEELFHWMNDPDAKVRTICAAVLESRGRTAEEIDFGRRLTHPRAPERLKLLVDLARDTERDIGPWLERLARDAEPAVRAGAVRVACERKLQFADWTEELAKNDPDATVRQVANFHRRNAAGLIEPAGYEK